jgi:hypothetical protein
MKKVKETGSTPLAFGINDYDSRKEYVKIGSTQSYIEKPEWMYKGPPPEPRIFELVSTGNKKYLVEKSLTKLGANVVSGVHCASLDYYEIYKLVPINLPDTISGGKKYIRKNNRIKNTHRLIRSKKTMRHKKTIKHSNNKHKKTIKRSNRLVKNKTKSKKNRLVKNKTRKYTKP